jgi:uncharacterized repeat protein (TIGR04138 family)
MHQKALASHRAGVSWLKAMQQLNFEDILDRIVEKDKRYDREAYVFLREALEFTQKAISKSNKNQVRHISGQELLNGIRDYALSAYGPMSLTLLEAWGIRTCEDFGNMVFLMVENNLLRKTEQDSIEDFKLGYDFQEAFRKPFLPSRVVSGMAENGLLPEPTRVEQN